jgi:CheY-like chemotaxis protein
MSARPLSGLRILIVEDQAFIALQSQDELEAAGAIVVGPVHTVERALAALKATPELDGAVLDVNLQGERVFPVADALSERGVPFIFVSGFGRDSLPPRYRYAPHCRKPVSAGEVERAINTTMAKFMAPPDPQEHPLPSQQ